MLFKNAKFAKLTKLGMDYEVLQTALLKRKFVPTSPNQESSVGWVSPFGDDADVMSLSQGNAHLLKLKIEEKKVPSSAINEELRKKIKELREQDPEIKIAKAEKANLREDIKFKLLPRVLPTISYIELYIDMDNNLLVVNATSETKWDIVIAHLTSLAGDEFEFEYFSTETDPSDAMTRWIKEWDIPAGFSVGEECKLKDMGEEKTEITYKKHDLQDEKISNYLNTMSVVKLALELHEEISFQIDASKTLSKIKFLDMYKEKRKEDLDSIEDESSRFKIELDVDFSIMKGAFAKLLPEVIGMFKED